jgi:4-hydroxybenzoate polyprenyltransferase|tara:strand:+ start:39 stop:908 length:870 start_codon:yes stop_codon:yes gene_type:complete
MNQINLFIELIRLKKPIGFMLLFWPCAWGLTIAYDFAGELRTYIFYLTLFLSGSILMRSAGCIINDIADKEFDKKVIRTKDRPIASEKISISSGVVYSVLLCLTALMVLIQFNELTIFLALISMPLAFMYPFTKRFTYWPQLFLGVTFNYGLLLGWTSVTNDILDLIPFILYFGAIFWTLGYDTIYGYQDIKDDEVIGLKSTSIKFKSNPYIFLRLCYSSLFLSLIIIGYNMEFKNIFFIMTIIIFLSSLYFFTFKLNVNSSNDCLKSFRLNNFLGFLIFLTLIIGKLY